MSNRSRPSSVRKIPGQNAPSWSKGWKTELSFPEGNWDMQGSVAGRTDSMSLWGMWSGQESTPTVRVPVLLRIPSRAVLEDV